MEILSEKKCEVCKSSEPAIGAAEVNNYMKELPEWDIVEIENVKRLIRTFQFADFNAALAFTNKVGVIAENEGHHPAILTEWGKVTVSWWTHKISGLHINDFIMAARTDRIK